MEYIDTFTTEVLTDRGTRNGNEKTEADIFADRPTKRQTTDVQADRGTHRGTGRLKDSHPDRQAERQTGRQVDSQPDKQTANRHCNHIHYVHHKIGVKRVALETHELMNRRHFGRHS